jgi:hypothetical protein
MGSPAGLEGTGQRVADLAQGSLTVWLGMQMQWQAPASAKPGHPAVYSEAAAYEIHVTRGNPGADEVRRRR